MVSFPGCSAKKGKAADMVLKNGKIITMDPAIPRAEAVAILKGRIIAVGSNKEIDDYITDETSVRDLEGKLVIPGFIESHAHFSSLGMAKRYLDLTVTHNWDDIVLMVKLSAEKRNPGEWIVGRGWHQEKWDRVPNPNVEGLPLNDELSKVSPQNPVMLIHASGHSCIVNKKAMEVAGVDSKTPDPAGGKIIKDGSGRPIGAFLETAMDFFYNARDIYNAKRTPQQIKEENRDIAELADRECSEKGITTFHDAGASYDTIELYKSMILRYKLHTRLYVMIGETNDRLKNIGKYKIIGFGNNHLTVRAIKRLIDGALGAHGAWLLEPYDSLPTSTGLNTEPIEAMKETARIAVENGFQLCTHAIGDRGNRETLDIYEEAFNAHPGKKDLRWRIEHAQHLHPVDIPRFAKLGVIAAMQGVHCISDGPWVPKRIGNKRAEEGAYAWKKLIDAGTVVSNGTDAPVEDVSPIACYYASVTRRMKDGNVFFGQQRMTRLQALQTYTINGAYAAFEEKIKGSVSVGKLADIAVLSKDITTIPEEEILSTEVVYTIVGGYPVYQNNKYLKFDLKSMIRY